MMKTNRFLSAAMFLGLLLVVVPGGTSTAAEIRLESSSPGLRVMMKGPVSVSGMTPIRIQDLPVGDYRLDFDGWGLVTGGGRLTVGRDGSLDARPLHGMGSLLLPPGLASFDAGNKARGLIFLGLGAGTLAGAIKEDRDRRDARDDYLRALDAYDRATSPEEARQQRLLALSAHDLEQDRKEVRNLWGTYVGALWLGSGLEAWLLTPSASMQKASDDAYRMDVPSAGGAGAGLRSFLVPGAGQKSLGHEGRGNRFLLAVGILGAASIVSHDAFLDARRDQRDLQRRYDAAVSEEEISKLSQDLQRASDHAGDLSVLRWGLLALTGGVHLWNVLDATSLGHNASEPRSLGLGLTPGDSGFQVGLTWRTS